MKIETDLDDSDTNNTSFLLLLIGWEGGAPLQGYYMKIRPFFD